MKQNLVLAIGFCLCLVLNAGEACPSSTAGLAGASGLAVPGKPVAVNNPAGSSQGSSTISGVASAPVGGAVAAKGKAIPVDYRLAEPPPFHIQGTATMTRFHLSNSYDPAERSHARHVADQIIAHLRDDAPLTARRVLETDGEDCLDPEDIAALRVRVAAGLLYNGDNKAALVLAESSITGTANDALWTAGLAAWRLRQTEKAVRYFSTVANSNPDPWTKSAAAFWVARALTASGDAPGARPWLMQAAARKGTFYGMLAQRALDDADAIKRDPTPLRNSAAYAVPHWKPRDGFTVDPALIYAIMRQESKFDPQAQSDSGALGLMQIMPGTAGQVTQRDADWETELLDPETNMDIGQRYVRTLLQSDGISNNLIRMAVAYNGGPNALEKFRHASGESDPLVFLEIMPAVETRGYVEQVLANYWNYRLRLGEDTTTLSDLAAGKWPIYTPPPVKPTLVADAR